MALKLSLPDKPVDRFVVRYWCIGPITNDVYEVVATYYTHSKYEDVFPGERGRGGAPLIDDWLVQPEGRSGWRWCGWNSIREPLAADREVFPTKRAAQRHLRRRLEDDLARAKAKMDELAQEMARLKKELSADDLPELCSLCGADPALPENRGRQLYVCSGCEDLVCSDCSRNTKQDDILCLPCAEKNPGSVIEI